METATERLKGGAFLLAESDLNHILIPEEFSDEIKMIAQTADEFVDKKL